jgi:hypothetical protein
MLHDFIKFVSEECISNDFVHYEWSDRVIQRGNQTFAVFGSIAYDVTKLKFHSDVDVSGTGKLCVPIKERYLGQFPDEGDSGILGLYIVYRRNEKRLIKKCFVPCGWVYTRELTLSNSEIKNNIIEDVIRGENVFTKKPAGWV